MTGVLHSSCGAFVNGERPRYKKDLKAAIEDDPETVSIEDHSMFTAWKDGETTPITEAEHGTRFTVCGPDPQRSRNWWANVTVTAVGFIVE